METLYLAHHGIKGQKWGVRRFQNKDGSYTNEGKRRYLSDETKGKIKKAAKVAAGVAGAAAIGYGAYKIGKASGRYNRAQVYGHASNIASKITASDRGSSKFYTRLAEGARKSGNIREARIHEKSAYEYDLSSRVYDFLADSYSTKVSTLRNYGGKSDRIAYSFVERFAKNRPVNWRDVEKLLDANL